MGNVTHEIFGDFGRKIAPVLKEVIQDVNGTTYSFVPNGQFESILDLPKRNKIYWEEILTRAHMASAACLIRHQRWMTGCLESYRGSGNYLGFCASLRGMTEAAADAWDGLGGIANDLADNFTAIDKAIKGEMEDWLGAAEIESKLIHFIAARNTRGEESPPESHKAKQPWQYFKGLEQPGEPELKTLYGELCQVVHPAAQSMSWMFRGSGDRYKLFPVPDRELIKDLVVRHHDSVEWVELHNVNSSLLTLKLLNEFSLPHLVTESVEKGAIEKIPINETQAWKKIQRSLRISNSSRKG